MVRVYSYACNFDYPWENVTSAFFRKYQPTNPFVAHIEGYDIISRYVDPVTKCLVSKRLISKKGKLPKWGEWLISKPQAYVIETAIIDPVTKTMSLSSENVTHKTVMYVKETQVFRVHPDNESWTQVTTEAQVVSSLAWGLRGQVEAFGVSRFQKSANKSREALRFTLERLFPHLVRSPAPPASS